MTHASVLGIAPIQASVSEAEWQARVDLAACYRLCDRYGMSDMIYTHITTRVPDAPGQFLINPNGLLFSEMTASSLLKVNEDGEVLYRPDLPYGLHPAGFTIHSAIYRARPDAAAAYCPLCRECRDRCRDRRGECCVRRRAGLPPIRRAGRRPHRMAPDR